MSLIEQDIGRVIHYLTHAGTRDYIGESVSQLEHALQCAYFAKQAGHSDEVVFASLLHDIGHFASASKQHQMADLGVVHHEWIGAKLAYELHFSPKVALLIGYHVDAKRYLAGKNPAYYQRLSDASRRTLSYQGGPMDEAERRAFEALAYFKEILQVRVNDERAKEPHLEVPPLAHYALMMREHLRIYQRQADDGSYPLSDFVTTQWIDGFKAHLYERLLSKEGIEGELNPP